MSKKKNSSDSSDEEIDKLFHKTKKTNVLEEFSIDNLLKIREIEKSNLKTPELEESAEQTSDNDEVVFVPPIKINDFMHRDGSVFEFSQGNFPFRVFEAIEFNEEEPKSHCFPKLKQWQWMALKYHPELVMPSVTALFSLMQELIVADSSHSSDIGVSLLKYIENFPKHSINFKIFFDLLKESTYNAPQAAVFLLAISDFENFVYKDINEDEAHTSIILIHIAALLCPAITENRFYGHASLQFRKNFDYDIYTNEQVDQISDVCFNLATDVPLTNISQIVTLLPLNGIGANIANKVTIQLALHLLKVEEILNHPTLEDLAKNLHLIKKLCESTFDSDLIAASAVLALSERAVVSSLKVGGGSIQTIQSMVKSLKFSINSSDLGMLTALKEQIHVTRTQFETLMCNVFELSASQTQN